MIRALVALDDQILGAAGPAGERRGPIHDLEVQMQPARASGVAEPGDHLAAPDPSSGLDPDATRLQVGVEGEPAVPEGEDHVVAIRLLDPGPGTAFR